MENEGNSPAILAVTLIQRDDAAISSSSLIDDRSHVFETNLAFGLWSTVIELIIELRHRARSSFPSDSDYFGHALYNTVLSGSASHYLIRHAVSYPRVSGP